MIPAISEVLRDLKRTLESLDEASRHSTVGVDQRKEPRRPLRATCDVFLFKGTAANQSAIKAVARNLTFGGISLVFTTDEPIKTGRPVEIRVTMPDMRFTHLAGVVVFCRKVSSDCFELGVEVKAAGRHSIVAHDVTGSTKLYDWFATALQLPQ